MAFNLTSDGREIVENYVKKMLGCPVVKLELDDSQLQFAIDEATEYVNTYLGDTIVEEDAKFVRILVNRGALAHAKLILGRIRSKYEKVRGVSNKELDGSALIAEGRDEIREFRDAVKHYTKATRQ